VTLQEPLVEWGLSQIKGLGESIREVTAPFKAGGKTTTRKMLVVYRSYANVVTSAKSVGREEESAESEERARTMGMTASTALGSNSKGGGGREGEGATQQQQRR